MGQLELIQLLLTVFQSVRVVLEVMAVHLFRVELGATEFVAAVVAVVAVELMVLVLELVVKVGMDL
jgi:hypothetical protein